MKHITRTHEVTQGNPRTGQLLALNSACCRQSRDSILKVVILNASRIVDLTAGRQQCRLASDCRLSRGTHQHIAALGGEACRTVALWQAYSGHNGCHSADRFC
jgi:hypothetical protein